MNARSNCELVQTPTTPREIYITGVGSTAAGRRIDLKIVNETEYRAWRVGLNGIKRERQREREAAGLGESFGYVRSNRKEFAGQDNMGCPAATA